jgi:hypothetical protein
MRSRYFNLSLTPRYRYSVILFQASIISPFAGLVSLRLGCRLIPNLISSEFSSECEIPRLEILSFFPSTRPLDSAAQHIKHNRPGILSVAYFVFQLMQLAISWRGDGYRRYHKSWPSIVFTSNRLLGRRQRDHTD